MDEFDCAWPTGLFVRVQQCGRTSCVGSRTKHAAAHDDGHAAGVGSGTAIGNLERGETRRFARPRAFLGYSDIIGDPGSRARARLADSDGAEWLLPDWRAPLWGPPGVLPHLGTTRPRDAQC